jgi:hypothetical protein
MREITDHIVSGDQAVQLKINVTDEPGAGGACHNYAISWAGPVAGGPDDFLAIHFQEGAIKENGVNGITQEALLAIVIDRLRSFQAGPYPSEENDSALALCEAALECLKKRTLRRIARGVEGTHQR